MAHFWTLSVEEHFYLVAPLLMLTLSVRSLSWLCVLSWLLAAVGRIVCVAVGRPEAVHLSPMQFDCMTVGIAAAIYQAQGQFLGLGQLVVQRIVRWSAFLLIPVLMLRRIPGDFGVYFEFFPGTLDTVHGVRRTLPLPLAEAQEPARSVPHARPAALPGQDQLRPLRVSPAVFGHVGFSFPVLAFWSFDCSLGDDGLSCRDFLQIL